MLAFEWQVCTAASHRHWGYFSLCSPGTLLDLLRLHFGNETSGSWGQFLSPGNHQKFVISLQIPGDSDPWMKSVKERSINASPSEVDPILQSSPHFRGRLSFTRIHLQSSFELPQFFCQRSLALQSFYQYLLQGILNYHPAGSLSALITSKLEGKSQSLIASQATKVGLVNASQGNG